MEYNLTDLKKKKVINVADGKDLGKITEKLKESSSPGRKTDCFFRAN